MSTPPFNMAIARSRSPEPERVRCEKPSKSTPWSCFIRLIRSMTSGISSIEVRIKVPTSDLRIALKSKWANQFASLGTFCRSNGLAPSPRAKNQMEERKKEIFFIACIYCFVSTEIKCYFSLLFMIMLLMFCGSQAWSCSKVVIWRS